MADKKLEEMSYKEASDELEAIVHELEEGSLELEDALARYTRGVELLNSLRERLSNAEQKVTELLKSSEESSTKLESMEDAMSAPITNPFGEE